MIITEENKEMYESYLKLQSKPSKKDLTITTILSLTACSTGFSLLPFISSSILYHIVGSLSVVSVFGVVAVRLLYIQKRDKKKMKEQYPDFDMTLSISEIEKALDKYNESKKRQEMLVEDTSFRIETTEEKVNVVNTFMSMSREEKVAFLEKEKDFWKQEQQRNQLEEQANQKKYI